MASQRLDQLQTHLQPPSSEHQDLFRNSVGTELVGGENAPSDKKEPAPDDKNTLTVTDNRTGKTLRLRITDGTIRALDLRPLKLKVYDPAFLNTAVARSKITYIDGEKGLLWYRGYPIEELAEKSTFLEVAFLLINGSLPTKDQLDNWTTKIMTHTFIHENLTELMKTFRYDAHPHGILISSVAALSTFYAEANPALRGSDIYNNAAMRNKQIYRIIGKLPTIAACAYRHRIGRPYNQPVNGLSYTENFLYMLDRLQESEYRPNPTLARALDVLFILHADHELNCSTAAMRHIVSARTDPYSAVAGAAAALYGPLHGGANEAVLHMLERIGTVENIPKFIADVKAKKEILYGFGHRIYKHYDPRAKIIRKIAYEVFDVVGKEPLIEVATALEQTALKDEYFVKRELYPNVDFYSGLIYKAMGFPTDMFPVLFCIPRAAGWLAHWVEALDDPEQKIWRPQQVYVGETKRSYVPLEERRQVDIRNYSDMYSSPFNKRRAASLGARSFPGSNAKL